MRVINFIVSFSNRLDAFANQIYFTHVFMYLSSLKAMWAHTAGKRVFIAVVYNICVRDIEDYACSLKQW